MTQLKASLGLRCQGQGSKGLNHHLLIPIMCKGSWNWTELWDSSTIHSLWADRVPSGILTAGVNICLHYPSDKLAAKAQKVIDLHTIPANTSSSGNADFIFSACGLALHVQVSRYYYV